MDNFEVFGNDFATFDLIPTENVIVIVTEEYIDYLLILCELLNGKLPRNDGLVIRLNFFFVEISDSKSTD